MGDLNLNFNTGIRQDKFGMTNVASPTTLFDAQFTYDLQPLLYEQVVPTGSTITHDAINRAAVIAVNTAGTINTFLQSYDYFRYQPGKAQRIYITFNFRGASANAVKYAQYGDSTNAFRVELRPDGTAWARIITSTTEGNQEIQITNPDVDWTKEQILVLEFEALYVGSVGFTLQLEDKLVDVAVINNSNNSEFPYIATANLPLRVGIQTTGAANTNILFNCVSVQSSGGIDDTVGYPFIFRNAVTAANGARTHLASIRPKLTFNGIQNHAQIILIEIEILVTGNNSIEWDLSIGQEISGASYANVNTTYSTVEGTTAGTLVGSPALIVDAGYVGSSGQTKGSDSKKLTARIPLTLDAAGAHRALGTITLSVLGIGGASACRGTIKWIELR
jgi:hypothetical protein